MKSKCFNFIPRKIFIFIFVVSFFFSPSFLCAKSYERIVSLSPSITEILFALGAGNQVVGVTTYCEYPPEAKAKPKVGGFTNQNLEAIIHQKPDLVILNPNSGTKFTYERLKQIGIEALVVPLYSWNDLLETIKQIGEAVGHPKETEELRNQFLKISKQIRIRSVNRPRKKVVLVNWHSPIIAAAGGTIEGNLIKLAGGENIIASGPLHYIQLSAEALFAQDPDLIIDASRMGKKTSFEQQREMVKKFWHQYSELRAVKSGEVYVFKDDVYSVPGPRTIQLMKAIDAILDPTTNAKNEFYERIKP